MNCVRTGRLGLALFLLGSLALSALSANAAILFSGGGVDPLTVTFTADVTLPLTAAPTGNRVVFMLEDVYTAGNYDTAAVPSTPYAEGIQAAIDAAGGAVAAEGYDQWGTVYAAWGLVDRYDFYGMFTFAATPATAAGDLFTIKAGSVTLPATGTPLPNLAASAVQLADFETRIPLTAVHSLAVPEPAAGALAAVGIALVWLRRRGR